jgi:sigma-54 dependent transcriptional regulator, acetoin dehydrogenase operon transcriptional activator AcoR
MEDLYYRLNGLVLRLPALRERTDLDVLAQRILQAEIAHGAPHIAPALMVLLRRYAWPGNVRQLAGVLRTAAVMAAGEAQITQAHLSDDLLDDIRCLSQDEPQSAAAAVAVVAVSPAAPGPFNAPTSAAAGAAASVAPGHAAEPANPDDAPARTLGQAELEMIHCALAAAGGNISEASKRLGISRNTIYRKLRWNKPT